MVLSTKVRDAQVLQSSDSTSRQDPPNRNYTHKHQEYNVMEALSVKHQTLSSEGKRFLTMKKNSHPQAKVTPYLAPVSLTSLVKT